MLVKSDQSTQGIRRLFFIHYRRRRSIPRESPVRHKKFYFGTDEMFLGAAAMGTDGGIGSTYNVQMPRVKALGAAIARGDMGEAQRLQGEMNALIDVLIANGVNPSVKYLLSLQGLAVGECRAPFAALDDAARRSLDEAAKRYLNL